MSKILRNNIAIALLAFAGIALVAVLVGIATASIANAATFERNLKVGMSGNDVMELQKVLNASADTQVSSSGAGSPGNESTYFGSKTKAAVIKWQNKYASEVLAPAGLTSGTGFVGSFSRAKLNAGGVSAGGLPAGCTSTAGYSPTTGQKCDSGAGSTIPTTGGALSVGAASQPANGLAIVGTTGTSVGASRVPFTRVTLTAGANDVTVSGITVERVGAAVDAVFSGVLLLDENGAQIGVAKTLNSNHQVTVGDPFVVRAGTSRTMTVAGNMTTVTAGSVYAGQVVAIQVNAVNTSGTVSGSLPIVGAYHTVNSTLAIGTATLTVSSFDPNSTTITKRIGDSNYKFAGARIQAGSNEQVRLRSIRWNQTGSAGSSDLANITVYVDGTAYPTSVDSTGKYFTANFGAGIVIDKGLSKDAYVQGDIVGATAAGRTVQFDLYKNTDIYLTGEIYGYGITATPSGNTAATATDGSEFLTSDGTTAGTALTPFFSGSKVSVSAGSVSTVSKSNSAPAQNIALNAVNQVLGAYEVDLKGEAISVQNHTFYITSSVAPAAGTILTNVTLYGPNGNVVAGPKDAEVVAGTNQKVAFTDTVTYPVGLGTYTLKGKVDADVANGTTYQASTTPSTDWSNVTGQVSGNNISLSTLSSAVAMNVMTVKSGALAMSVSSQPSSRTVIAGAKGFEFSRYVLDAGQSGEEVRVSTFKALLALTTITASQLGSCNLYDGSTNVTGDTSVTLASGDNNFTFNGGGLFIPKGTQKVLSMKCDLSAGATSGDVKWGLTDNASSYTGAVGTGSNQTITETMTASAGPTMTASSGGSYTVTEDTSMLYKASQAGLSNVELARFRFTAGAAEDVDLKQIALQLGNTSSNSPADLLNQRVTLWNGSTFIGCASFGGANPDNATSTVFGSGITCEGQTVGPAPRITAGDSVVITVKGNLNPQNVNDGTPGAFMMITYDGNNNGINGNYATGASSQSTVNGTSGDVTSAGTRIFRTVPSFAVTSTGGTLQAGADLYKFTVTNPNTRDVVFQKFSFSFATTGSADVNVNALTLYGDGTAFNTSAVTYTTAGADLEIPASGTSNAQIVPANSTKTYVLKAATVTNPSTTVIDSVSIALLADTSFPSLANLMGTKTSVEAGAANTDNIIWSPFSTTTPVATVATQDNLDWVNGYGLPGFPSGTAFPVQTWTSAN